MTPPVQALCPVCRWPSLSGETVCSVCDWRLTSGWIAGPASADDHRDLADRLAAACQDHDLRAAVRSASHELGHRADRISALARLVRGGQPSQEKVDRFIAEVSADNRSHQATTAGTGFALARLMAGEVDAIAFLEIGPDGASVEMIFTNDQGVPRSFAARGRLPWERVMPRLSGDRDLRGFQLAGGIGVDHGDAVGLGAEAVADDRLTTAFEYLIADASAEVAAAGISGARAGRADPRLDTVLVRRTFGFTVLEHAAARARLAVRPVADIFQPPDAGSFEEIVRQIASRAPLRFSYELILVAVDARDGAVTVDEYELFPAGAVAKAHPRPEQVELVTPPHAAPELLLPIVARQGEDARDWPVIGAVAMNGAAPGSTKLSVSLGGPGTVTVQASPNALQPSARTPAWPDLLDQLPRYLPRSGPLDVAFFIELAGHQEEVDSRLTLVRGVVDYLATASSASTVRVAVAGYRDHYSLTHHRDAEEEDHQLVVLYPLAPIESARALLAPRKTWQAVPKQHYQVAPIEDALYALTQHEESWRRGARHMLIVVGSRPPHPPIVDSTGRQPTPCPYGHDWQSDLTRMRTEHNIECVSVLSDNDVNKTTGYATKAWNELAASGLFTIDKAGMDRLVQSVGLMATAATARLTLASERRQSR